MCAGTREIICLPFNAISAFMDPGDFSLFSSAVWDIRSITDQELTMVLRLAKVGLVIAVALFYSVVVFNNITDYDSNYQFVRHVLMMDTTFPGNHGMGRAINSPGGHTAFYLSIILWELLTMIFCWWGGWRLAMTLRSPAGDFHRAKRMAVVGLTLGLAMWLVAFLSVGGEWFLMWQSRTWNGQEAAFRMFTVLGIVLLLVAQPDTDGQP
jgi:predicted small integral membrane protein